ncbi:hypothetical protein PanABDRAFT_0048 [Pantoea sp. aB]|jgi:hypothetical protein|nr:hypothetical protein PanABDRAFT_0048 [Pantoea sp. aB]
MDIRTIFISAVMAVGLLWIGASDNSSSHLNTEPVSSVLSKIQP